jgi:ectoine hydroxylase-related dioxygenase (phytanoyl-CoA dioxygenase family)
MTTTVLPNDLPPRIETPAPLSKAQVLSYIEDGFLAVSGLIDNSDLSAIREDAVRIARGEYPCEAIEKASPALTDDEVLKTILCIHQPHYVSPVMERYTRHPGVCGALSQITAAHLPYWDGSVKCMQSMLFVKPPNFQGQAWHQDEIYIPTRDRSLVGAWIALDDATIENGCLWVIPGSHRAGYLYPQRPHGNPAEFDFAQESHGFDESLEVPVEVKAGTVVFFNGYLLHRSRKNRSSMFRRVLVSHYCNAWSLLPWRVLEGETAASADRRCIIPVAGVDPYAWKGYDPPEGNVWLRTCQATEDIRAQSRADTLEEN